MARPCRWLTAAVCGAAATAAVVAGGSAVWADELPRVASATVCADQYVVALAAPGQVVAVSPLATDPWLSLMAEEAARFRSVRPSAEGYLEAGVDVVVTNAWTDHQTAALLERFGVTVIRLPMPDTYDGVADAIRTVAKAMGREARGEALVADMRRRLAAVAAAAAGQGQRALYVRPGGGTAGAETFVDAVMGTVGLTNHAALQGQQGWGSYSLEQFIATPPDMLVTSFFNPPHPGVYGAFGDHPAFVRRAEALPRADVPGAQWVCGGWSLAVAAEHLAREVSP